MNMKNSVTVEESAFPVIVERIDDEEGALVTLHRDFDEEGPEGEYVFLAFTPENAERLGRALIAAAWRCGRSVPRTAG